MGNETSFKSTKEESLGFLLWQTTTLWQREIKTVLEGVSLSHSRFVILASLVYFQEQKQEVNQTTIIDHTKLDKMTVSKSLKQLEKNNFIQRTEDKEDTRAKRIEITKHGFKLAVEAIKLVENIDEKFFSKINNEEKINLNKIFNKLKES